MILGVTSAISLAAILSPDGGEIYKVLELNKFLVASGEFWRLLTVTLVHGGEGSGYLIALMHLGFNMYALYICGPVVEQIYGPPRMAAFYVIAAFGRPSRRSPCGDGPRVVGASGAIFGLFGILFAASRLHLPMLDRRGRALVSQVGSLILVNIVFGFAVTGIDNAAHLGGLAAGLWLGTIIPPSRVQTMASLWQRPDEARTSHLARVPVSVLALAFGVVAIAVVIGLIVGTGMRT